MLTFSEGSITRLLGHRAKLDYLRALAIPFGITAVLWHGPRRAMRDYLFAPGVDLGHALLPPNLSPAEALVIKAHRGEVPRQGPSSNGGGLWFQR